MRCPLCIDTVLDVTHHGGIEVDICPKCKGVWLDRGELERLLEGSERRRPPPASVPVDGGVPPRPPKSKKQRKKSFADRLEDVFEEILDL